MEESLFWPFPILLKPKRHLLFKNLKRILRWTDRLLLQQGIHLNKNIGQWSIKKKLTWINFNLDKEEKLNVWVHIEDNMSVWNEQSIWI